MSDTATVAAPAPASSPTVTPAATTVVSPAPEVTTTQTVPAGAPVAPAALTGPISRQEARRAVRQTLKATSAPATQPTPSPAVSSPVLEPVQPLQVTVPATEATLPLVAPEATPAVEALPAVQAAASVTPTPVEPPKPLAPQTFRVEIGGDHPATRGRPQTFEFDSQDKADVFRALVNGTYYRVKDNQELQAQVRDLTEWKARREAGDTAQSKWQQTPQYKSAVERYHQIRDTVGQEAASEYWKGVESQFQQLADAEFGERWGQFESETAEREGQRWAEEAQRRATAWVPQAIRALPDYARWFNKAVAEFDAAMGTGAFSDPADPEYIRPGDVEGMHKAFTRRLQASITSKDSARAAYKTAQTQQQQIQTTAAQQAALAKLRDDRLKVEAVEQYKRSLAQTRTAVPPHPLGNVGPGVSQPAPVAAQSEPIPAEASPHQVRRLLRGNVREAARRYFQPR